MNYQNHKPTVVSTFSGCGGSSCGYKQAGYDIKLAVEMNDHAVATYKANFPTTPVYHGDIHNLTVEKVKEITGLKTGELDLFDGSPPCQGFSMAGKRDFCDYKNQLYNEYIRLLKGLQPKTFVMENVKGMVSGDMKLIFKDILINLKKAGYNVKAKLMNAKYYDCATDRQRVIFIGVRNDLNIPASHPKPQTRPKTIKEALNGYRSKYTHYSDNDFVKKVIHKVKPGEALSKYHPKQSYFNFKKLNLNKTCPTILRQDYKQIFWDDGRIVEPDELALIQSFPPNFKWIGSLREQTERIGNSVPPNLMKAISKHILDNILTPYYSTILRD